MKKCIIAAIESFENSLTLEEAASIPLSDKTVKSRIDVPYHRKFQHFLETYNALYTNVSLYCEVRWLSAGKCFEKFFAIRKEIFLFLQEYFSTKCDEFQFFFENLNSLCELVITDMTNYLNILNSKLQKTDQTILQLISHIDSFRRKLILFKHQLENNVFHFFPSCQMFEEHGTN
ncbi:F200A protein, partial [Acromyrmex insinuator]